MAKPRAAGTATTRGKKSSAKARTTRVRDDVNEVPELREIEGGSSIMVVQFSEPDPAPAGDIESFVTTIIATALASTKTRPNADKAWLFYLATERFHSAGLHCWVGIGPGVPPKIVDGIQAEMDSHGCQTSREHAVIAHHCLRPLLAVTRDGVEVPVGASSPDDATLSRLASLIIRRPFVIDLKQVLKNDLLGAMLLGGDQSPTFRLRYFHDDSLATFSFGRVDLQMFARHADGSFTAMTRFATTPPCVLSFDFMEPQLAELVKLVPSDVGERLVELLSVGRPFRVPPGTVVVGTLARPSPPESNESTPFMVERFLPLSGPEFSAHF